MICAYLDESGQSGSSLTDPAQPLLLIGAILVPETSWKTTQAAVRSLKREFAAELNLPLEDVELHGTELFGGKGIWRKVPKDQRLLWYRKCIDILAAQGLQLAIGACDKRKLAARYSNPLHPHYVALFLCLERIAKYAKESEQLATLIADDCSQDLRQLSKKTLKQYRESGAPFGPTQDISSIVDTFNFVDSRESEHLQLCDLALFAIRRFRALQDDMDGIYGAVSRQVFSSATMPY